MIHFMADIKPYNLLPHVLANTQDFLLEIFGYKDLDQTFAMADFLDQ